jgi:hypothetical protein
VSDVEITIEKAKTILDNFIEEVSEYIKNKKLSELPSYSELQVKEKIGKLYREDQYYFEKLAGYKANFYGIKNFFAKIGLGKTDRVLNRELDAIQSSIDQRIKHLDVLVSRAKQRINFYDRIIYLVSNMSYGDY